MTSSSATARLAVLLCLTSLGCFATDDGDCVVIDLTDPACSETLDLEVVLSNEASTGAIHILTAGEAFDASNRLTPGQLRQVTVGVDGRGNAGVVFRAGLNGVVSTTVTCPNPPTRTLKHVSWNGTTLVCEDWQ